MLEGTNITDQVEERVRAESEEHGTGGRSGEERKSVDDPRFLRSCLNNNERGDGILFATLHRDKYLFNKSTKDTWMLFNRHHWEIDKFDRSHAAVEEVAKQYGKLVDPINEELAPLRGSRTDLQIKAKDAADGQKVLLLEQIGELDIKIKGLEAERKKIQARIDRLRSNRGAKNCLEWAHKIGEDSLAITSEDFDLHPLLLACPNGVIDLRTGMLHDGQPGNYLLRGIPTEYHGCDDEPENWCRVISEIHQGKQEVIDFIQRLFGYCLTGLTSEQYFACFLGDGANGKGLMLDTLGDILGELSWNIEPEMLLEQKNARSSSGPNPDILSLHGRRLVIASETDEGRKISASKVKRLTGEDVLTGRAPHDKYEINFQPTHKILFRTNHPPRGLASDFAMFRRLLYIWYPLRYVADPEYEKQRDPQNAHLYRQKDDDLKGKLLKERHQIFGWLVKGCLMWLRDGLKPPEVMRANAEEVRLAEDLVGQFLTAHEEKYCTEDINADIPLKEIYKSYKSWYLENIDEREKNLIGKKKFTEQMCAKGFGVITRGGTRKITGIREIHGLI